MTTPSHRFDTYEGAASIVGVSSRTLRRWAKQGRLDVHVTADGQKLVDVDAALAIARQPAADPPIKPREIVSTEPLPPPDDPTSDLVTPKPPRIPAPVPDPPDSLSGQPVNDDTPHLVARLADMETAVALLIDQVQNWEERLAAVERTLSDALDPPDESM